MQSESSLTLVLIFFGEPLERFFVGFFDRFGKGWQEFMENFGPCKRCNGEGRVQWKDLILHITKTIDCPRCDGTGMSGESADLMDREWRHEFEQWLGEQKL